MMSLIVHLNYSLLYTFSSTDMDSYESIVIGAGPGGLSTVAALIDSGIKKIFWIDRDFKGGRFNTMYREISS
jgi:cation diffusion facilitator CzcD-associated flavoprotein CzcO